MSALSLAPGSEGIGTLLPWSSGTGPCHRRAAVLQMEQLTRALSFLPVSHVR